VVEPPEHTALERGQRAPARAAPIGPLDNVARPVAKERHRLAIEAREHQLAALARLDRAPVLVEHLGIAVILVHVREPRTRLALEAPRRDLGQPRQVVRAGPERRLDLRPGSRNGRAGLAGVPGDPDLRLLREVDTFLLRGLPQEQRVRWPAAD